MQSQNFYLINFKDENIKNLINNKIFTNKYNILNSNNDKKFLFVFELEKEIIDFEGEIQMASKDDRISLTLKCTECGEENYLTSKNKKKHPDRIELKKYCPRCKKVTLHREKKK